MIKVFGSIAAYIKEILFLTVVIATTRFIGNYFGFRTLTIYLWIGGILVVGGVVIRIVAKYRIDFGELKRCMREAASIKLMAALALLSMIFCMSLQLPWVVTFVTVTGGVLLFFLLSLLFVIIEEDRGIFLRKDVTDLK